MIAIDKVTKKSIRSHYQLGTLFYRLLWGPHIHHGLWHGDESVSQAQLQLTMALADLAEIKSGEDVLDVGCGMGGSSIWLAKTKQCHVTGITLSPVQRYWAGTSATLKRVGKLTRFVAEDVEKANFADASLDVVWSIECTEHLFDKPSFFQQVGRWLRPGGRVAICVWFEGRDTSRDKHREICLEVCDRFVCPSLATQQEYAQWMRDAGLVVKKETDWTQQVMKTWEICQQRVSRTGVRSLARLLDQEQVAFLDGFEVLLNAYRTGAMQYGALVAEKPRLQD